MVRQRPLLKQSWRQVGPSEDGSRQPLSKTSRYQPTRLWRCALRSYTTDARYTRAHKALTWSISGLGHIRQLPTTVVKPK
jgi:hypothetical protein